MLKWLFNRTLNSVWFGIITMLLVAAYIAIGSGRPDVREYFEMDEMAFFQAWPLKVLMAVLVANLVTVTFLRIPFTLPRYGVWMIHAGIVILIYGMAYYYSLKQEGLAFVPRGATVSHYYDRWERSLYMRIDGQNTGGDELLKDLPRFHATDDRLADSEDRKLSRKLRGIEPLVAAGAGQDGKFNRLTDALGIPGNLRLDVVGYWPYATVMSTYVAMGPSGGADAKTGFKVIATTSSGQSFEQGWAVGADGETVQVGEVEIEHRELGSPQAIPAIASMVGKFHHLDITIAGKTTPLDVALGGKYEVGGYTLAVTEFNPAFPAMNGQIVQLLTLMVTPPAESGIKPFRRQLIPGREAVTDWKLDVEGAGPMGKRQKEPLDPNLVTRYTFSDPLRLLPTEARAKKLILTAGEKSYLVETSVAGPASFEELKEPRKSFPLRTSDEGEVTITLERGDNLRRVEDVVEVAKEKRNRNAGEAGLFQVLAVRASIKGGAFDGWNQTVLVPFQQWALTSPWRGGELKLPGVQHTIQLQLGQRVRPIAPDMTTGKPAEVTLEKFELVSYAGGDAMSGMQRDFKSTLKVVEGNGNARTATAHMNSPVYFGPGPVFGGISTFGDSFWTLFQAQWDPQGQRFTVLGVGNRPGVYTMTLGCVLMAVGLIWAFYIKPLIIRSRKNKAIKEAEAKGITVKKPRPVLVEGMEGRVSV
jgi:hypothetical protein